MSIYNEYPSLKITENDLSQYTPPVQPAAVRVGVVGFSNWGKIGKAIPINFGERVKKIGTPDPADKLAHTAISIILGLQSVGCLFWRIPRTGEAAASGELTLFTKDGDPEADPVIPDEDFIIKFKAKYKGSFGNKIKVKVIQEVETVGTEEFISYNLQVIANETVVNTYNNVDFFDTNSTRYISIVLDGNEFIEFDEIVNTGELTQSDLDDIFTNYVEVELEDGEDGTNPVDDTALKTKYTEEIVKFKNLNEGRMVFILDTYKEFDAGIINGYLSLCGERKDCFLLTSTEAGIENPGTLNTDIAGVNSTSRGAIYTGWDTIYSNFYNEFIRIPSSFNVLRGFFSLARIWDPMAGHNSNGFYQGSKLDVLLNEAEAMPVLQGRRGVINPIIKENDGFYIKGQKTLLKSDTALNRINTRLALTALTFEVYDDLKTRQFITFNIPTERDDIVRTLNKLATKYIGTGLESIFFTCDEVLNEQNVVNDNALIVQIDATPLKTNEKIGIIVNIHESGWTIEERIIE